MEKLEEAEGRVVGGQECYRKLNNRFELIFVILGFVSASSGVSDVTGCNYCCWCVVFESCSIPAVIES